MKTVLIVDDASLVRLFYRSALEKAGFRVAEVMNGVEALERLLTAPVDLLIVDINMPQMDGLTLLNTLRQQTHALAAIPALVTSTGSGDQGGFAAARAAGANYYLAKPVDPEELADFAAILAGRSR